MCKMPEAWSFTNLRYKPWVVVLEKNFLRDILATHGDDE
jgi:hypothetical protein